jgi:hypothetical protein
MKLQATLTLGLLAFCLSATFWFAAPHQAAQVPFTASAQICGLITDLRSNSITIAGLQYSIAPGTVLPGVAAGQNLCLSLCFNEDGQIIRLNSSAPATATPQVCGFVSAFAPPLGGVNGGVNIGGAQIRLLEGIFFQGQNLLTPGTNACLYPLAVFNNTVYPGSFFGLNNVARQVRVPTQVRGTLFSGAQDNFAIGEPTVLTLDSLLNKFQANQNTFNWQTPNAVAPLEAFSLSTPNQIAQAVSCTEKPWDIVFHVASSGNTDGDMVTFKLLNADRTMARQIAMFTIGTRPGQGRGALLTQLHPDVKLGYGGHDQGQGFFAPFWIPAGTSGQRTLPLVLVFSPTSQDLHGCFQLAVEIKRAGGAGTTSVLLELIIVKRMEQGDDRNVSVGSGVTDGALGWYPTGRMCPVICEPCPIESSSLSGYVYCDTNNNGLRDNNETTGISGVTIRLTGPDNRTTVTDSAGRYSFSNLRPGIYTVTEDPPVGPPATGDGIDKEGNCGGVAGNDVISNIPVTAGAACDNYNFGERCDVPAGLSGYVYCDTNNNGMREAGEAGIPDIQITLTGPVNRTASTNSSGLYVFSNLPPGTYTVSEGPVPNPPATGDGIDKAGNCGGVAGNDVISGINVTSGANCVEYNFGENCTVSTKCSTVCWRATSSFLGPFASFPGGTVLISGVNANNPVGIQQNMSAVRLALQGSGTGMKDFNRTFVTAQLSLASAGGSASPVVFDAFWSPLSCSGITFASMTLSNGVTLTPASLLDTLFNQSVLALKENRFNDMGKLAGIWALLNGNCFY